MNNFQYGRLIHASVRLLCAISLYFFGAFFFLIFGNQALANPACVPGWQGTVLTDGESLQNWGVEADAGSSGSLELVPGRWGQAVQLNWNVGSGKWVQARYRFPQPVDLSKADIFGFTLHGGGPTETANTVGIMFADVNGVIYGYDMPVANNPGTDTRRGVNQINRWLINLGFPKKVFSPWSTAIDWSRINRMFVVVKTPASNQGGGSGQLKIDEIRYDAAAHWPRQPSFDTTHADGVPAHVTQRAVDYLLTNQNSTTTGLLTSWKEESSPNAWLYDQALALLVLTREGVWREQGEPGNDAARAAQRLASFLIQKQKQDGHWARDWDPRNGDERVDDGWVGDQAWWVMALSSYSVRSRDSAARSAAQRGAQWLASRIMATGQVDASTEGTVDVWWAMIATGRFADADRIQGYLLTSVWDVDLRYWWRGFRDPVIALDDATWLSEFSRHPRVDQVEKGLAALSFVRRTLITESDDRTLCGTDGQGPVSLWNEGTAQYVAAGGAGGKTLLEDLIKQQRADGCMPGSPDDWSSDRFGWLTRWCGVAPTAWLYFAVKGSPFPVRTDAPVIDFCPYGIWSSHGNGNWSKLHDLCSVQIVSADLDGNGQADLAVNFGRPYGIWSWMNRSTWVKLHDLSPISITAADLDGNGKSDLAINFGSPHGIWRWMNNQSWVKLHDLSPVSITASDLDGNGQSDLAVNFGDPYGLWVWMNNQSWAKLHDLSPASVTTARLDANAQQDLVVDFPPYGIWKWMNNTSWQKLHDLPARLATAVDLDGNGQDDLVISFGDPYGLWRWMNNQTWEKLHDLSPALVTAAYLDGNARQDLAIHFPPYGIWQWINNTSWVKLHDLPARQIIAWPE